ncbi:MAG TPA: amino acid permease [Gemmataceae bacterium]|nr:amino acid permease [Gemmataceae bacterium]
MDSAKAPVETRQRLPRVLGPWMTTAIVIGTVIGSGVFKKPYAVSSSVPEFAMVIAVWVLGGLLAGSGALALAEVNILFPRAGGNYVFLREGYGRFAGFLWGWVEFWIIRTGSIAALASVFAEGFHDVLRQARNLEEGTRVFSFWTQQGLTVAVIMGLALVNVRGVRWSGGLQLFITLVKIGSLLAIILLPFIMLGLTSTPSAGPNTANLKPIWPEPSDKSSTFPASLLNTLSTYHWGLFLKAMVGVIWAYHGWMNLGPISEEVKDPQRNIPRGLILGVGTIILLYLGANLAYYLVVPREDILTFGKDIPVSAIFARRLLGPIGGTLASAAIMISVFGALNGNILVGPRLLYAMGEDGMAPRFLRGVHPQYRTPATAILVMSGWASVMVIIVAVAFQMHAFGDPDKAGSKPPFDVITDFAMFGAIALETLAVKSIFLFRIYYPNAERPYRCPGYPVVPALYFWIMACVWLNMFMTQTIESISGIVIMLIGAECYLLFLQKRNQPPFTLAPAKPQAAE